MKMKMSMIAGLVAVLLIPAFIVVAIDNPRETTVPEGPEFGRDKAIRFILDNYEDLRDLVNPSKIRTPWNEENLTPKELVGYNTLQYTKGDWTVEVSNAVVLNPVFSVEIDFTGDNPFHWKGTVDQDGTVTVIEFVQ